ncbi:tetratricopeptide repeat protein [Methanobrevibacter sp.]|uniref:tetratricopeptide repeat protein n=1 Tax=Methanobrevibacter sp. TaxID=66852 RepID=UPI0025ECAFFC|nr:tetratricopeptide repeat protein [Methanobrevibacter sp.]MBR4447122.1 hypothetical protein [Methanobrevibacter sp.]
MTDDWDDIKVNRRKGDKVHFESTLLQQISDGIDFIRSESKEILEELDIQGIDEKILEEFGENALDQISDISDGLSGIKSDLIDADDIPEFLKEYSINAKKALNRDLDYVRRARRRLDRMDSNELVDIYKTNASVITLCDKAIEVNPSNYEAYYLKGLALVNLEEYCEAIEEFISCLALNEDYVDAKLAIANVNRLNKDYDDAINVYDSILKDDENSFEAIKGKAYTYFDFDDFQKAADEFKKADSIHSLDDESKRLWDECINKK